MNTIVNMDPWGFLDDLLDTSSRAFQVMRARASGRFPPVNVFLDDDSLIVDLELPGKTAKDVDLSLEPQAIVISGRPPQAQEGEASSTAPVWSRRIDLPFRVDSSKANAKFANGILRISLPKAEADGVKRITIEG